jgi:hypothetical protein
MKIKQIVLLCILCLFVGGIGGIYIAKNKYYVKQETVQYFVNSEIKKNLIFLDILQEKMTKIDTNLFHSTPLFNYNKLVFISKLYQNMKINILKNEKIDNECELLYKFIEEQIVLEPDKIFFDVIKEVKNRNKSIEARMLNLEIIINYLLNDYLQALHVHSIPAIGEVFNYTDKDTIGFGDIYYSKISFEPIGFGNYVIMDNGDTLKDCIFEEKALKLGNNHHKGYYYCIAENGAVLYEFDINYYVK